jgi:hypothetical protein
MAYQDFALFPGLHANNTTSFFAQESELIMDPRLTFPCVKKPDYTGTTTAARRSRSPTRDRDTSNYREQRSPAAYDRRPSRSEQPSGNMEDRQNSQQDRRVYVGNLSYDVKWHHLKDHMRDGMLNSLHRATASIPDTDHMNSWQCPLRRRTRAPERNEQG